MSCVQVESRYLKAYEDIEEFGKTGFGAPGARRVHRYMALGLSPPCAVDRQCLQRLCITPVDRLTGTSCVAALYLLLLLLLLLLLVRLAPYSLPMQCLQQRAPGWGGVDAHGGRHHDQGVQGRRHSQCAAVLGGTEDEAA